MIWFGLSVVSLVAAVSDVDPNILNRHTGVVEITGVNVSAENGMLVTTSPVDDKNVRLHDLRGQSVVPTGEFIPAEHREALIQMILHAYFNESPVHITIVDRKDKENNFIFRSIERVHVVRGHLPE